MADGSGIDPADFFAAAQTPAAASVAAPSPVQLPGVTDFGTVHPAPQSSPNAKPDGIDPAEFFASAKPPEPTAPATPQMTGLSRAAALPATGLAEGLMQTLAPFAAEGANPMGMSPMSEQMTNIAPQLPAIAMQLGREAGLYDRPDLTPTGPIEKGVVSAARGAGRTLPFAPIAGPGAALFGALTGAGGGVAGDVAQAAFPNHPVLAQTVGNVAGSLGTSGIVSGLARLAMPALQATTRALSSGAEASQAADRVAAAMQQDIDSGAVTVQDFQTAQARGLQPWELENAENTRALASSLARSGGPARTAMRAYVKGEDVAAPSRIEDAFAQGLGSGDIHAAAGALSEQQMNAASPLYQQAFAANQNVASPMLDRIMQTPAGQEALSGARQRMQNKMILMGRPDPDLMEQAREAGQYVPGGKGVASGMKLQTWDLIKQDLDGQINRLKRGVISGTVKPSEVADVVALKKGLVGELDRLDSTAQAGPNSLRMFAKPDGTLEEGGFYKQARMAWSGPAQSLDAIEEGAKVLSKTPHEITTDLAALSPGDADLYRLSAMQQAVGPRSIGGGTLGSNEGARVLANTPDKLKPQLEALFPDEATRNAALAAAQRANLKFQAKQAVSGGSQTVERAVDQASLSGGHGGKGSMLGNAISGAVAMHTGEPFLGLNYLQRLASDILGRHLSVSPSLNKRMVDVLTGSQSDLAPALAQLKTPGAPTVSPYPLILGGQAASASQQPQQRPLLRALMAPQAPTAGAP